MNGQTFMVRYEYRGRVFCLYTDDYEAATDAQFALTAMHQFPVQLWRGGMLVGTSDPTAHPAD